MNGEMNMVSEIIVILDAVDRLLVLADRLRQMMHKAYTEEEIQQIKLRRTLAEEKFRKIAGEL